MTLEYVSQEKPTGTDFESLKKVKEKARNVLNSDHCKNDFPLGKVWCSRMRRLSQLDTESVKKNEYLSDILDEDYKNYLVCVRFAGSDPNGERLNSCKETCKPGHKYRFTCETLAQIQGRKEKNPRVTRYQDKCYGERSEDSCRKLCEYHHDLSACNPFKTAAIIRTYESLDSPNPQRDDPNTVIRKASITNRPDQVSPEKTTIVKGNNNTVIVNQSSNEQSVDTEHEILKDAPYYRVGLRASSKMQDQFQPQTIDSSSIDLPDVNVRSDTQIGNFKNGGTDSLSPSIDVTATASTLPYSAVLPPRNRTIKVKGKLDRASKNKNQTRTHPASFAQAGQSLGGIGSAKNNKKRRNRRRVSRGLPYKKYRDNLGGNTFYGAQGSIKNQGNSKISKSSPRKKARQISSKTRRSSSLPSPESILKINKGFQKGFPHRRELLLPQESLFNGVSRSYDDVEKDRVLDEKGR